MTKKCTLESLRLDAGKTQVEVAEEIATWQHGISAWEHGKARPSSQFVVDYAAALGVTVEKLMRVVKANLKPKEIL